MMLWAQGGVTKVPSWGQCPGILCSGLSHSHYPLDMFSE